MGGRTQHHAGLHMRNIDQIGMSFEDHKSNYRYSYLFDRAPDDPEADKYIAEASSSKKKQKQGKTSKPNEHLSIDMRKKSKPIQKTLFSDVLENEHRMALVFDLQIETLEPGKYYPTRSQKLLLIHKSPKFDPSVLTKEQYRFYQAGLLNNRLIVCSAQESAAQNMLRQHVTKKTFGYETDKGRHLVTVRSWK